MTVIRKTYFVPTQVRVERMGQLPPVTSVPRDFLQTERGSWSWAIWFSAGLFLGFVLGKLI